MTKHKQIFYNIISEEVPLQRIYTAELGIMGIIVIALQMDDSLNGYLRNRIRKGLRDET